MAPTRFSADQLADWYAHKRPMGGDRATVSVATLARLFIEEGQAEGVAGDVAFVQTMIETGWLTFPDRGQVRPWFNNFSGIGAVDGGSAAGPATFADARLGVRAQIQHLRAYADPTVTTATLHRPLIDPRFHLVSPKGKARTWEALSGTWASDVTYGSKITRLYAELSSFSAA